MPRKIKKDAAGNVIVPPELMYRTKKCDFEATSETLAILAQAQVDCGFVWDYLVEYAHNYWRATGRSPGLVMLQNISKGLGRKMLALHSQSIQAVVHTYIEAVKAAREARKLGLRNKYPYRHKEEFQVVWTDKSFCLRPDGRLTLSQGTQNGKRLPWLVVQLQPDSLAGIDKVTEVKLLRDKNGPGFIFELVYALGVVPETKTNGEEAAGDLGVINTITLAASGGAVLQINGRKLRATNQLRNKRLASITKLIKRCSDGSKRQVRLVAVKHQLLNEMDRSIRDQVHKITNTVVAWCRENNVKRLTVGDLEGIQRHRSAKNKKTTKKRRRSRRHKQEISNWLFGELVRQLTYKLQFYGIVVAKQDEAYSSSTCPRCLRQNKPKGRVYTCKCGGCLPRDVVGASNQLAKVVHGKFAEMPLRHIKYLRAAQRRPIPTKMSRGNLLSLTTPARSSGPEPAQLPSLILLKPECRQLPGTGQSVAVSCKTPVRGRSSRGVSMEATTATLTS